METQQSEGRSTSSVCAGRTSTLNLFFFVYNEWYYNVLFYNRIAYIYFYYNFKAAYIF